MYICMFIVLFFREKLSLTTMTSVRRPQPISEVTTPCFLVDVDIVRRNAQSMIDRCNSLGLKLRPHMKTHKCTWVPASFNHLTL